MASLGFELVPPGVEFTDPPTYRSRLAHAAEFDGRNILETAR